MKGMFCFTRAGSNEEFRRVLKRRSCLYLSFCVLGLLTIGAAFLANGSILDDYRRGFLYGMGSGMLAGGGGLFFRTRRILRKEEAVREERLKCTDERELAIASRAMKCGAFTTVIALYGMAIWGIFFNETLVRPAILMICIFIFSYVVANKFFQTRM